MPIHLIRVSNAVQINTHENALDHMLKFPGMHYPLEIPCLAIGNNFFYDYGTVTNEDTVPEYVNRGKSNDY